MVRAIASILDTDLYKVSVCVFSWLYYNLYLNSSQCNKLSLSISPM